MSDITVTLYKHVNIEKSIFTKIPLGLNSILDLKHRLHNKKQIPNYLF